MYCVTNSSEAQQGQRSNQCLPAVISQHVKEAHLRGSIWVIRPQQHLLMEGYQTEFILIGRVEGFPIFLWGKTFKNVDSKLQQKKDFLIFFVRQTTLMLSIYST